MPIGLQIVTWHQGQFLHRHHLHLCLSCRLSLLQRKLEQYLKKKITSKCQLINLINFSAQINATLEFTCILAIYPTSPNKNNNNYYNDDHV